MDCKEKLLTNTKNWYQSIKAIEAQTKEKAWCELNFFWGADNYKLMLSILNESKTAEEAIKNIAKTELFSINADSVNPLYDAKEDADKINKYAVDWHITALKSAGVDLNKLPKEVDESGLFSEKELTRQGRKVSPDFFRLLHVALMAQKTLKNTKAPRVLELGAGTGELARFVNHLLPVSQYIICDIPETLCFSYLFLSLHFPKDKMLLIKSADDLNSLALSNAKFIFIPTIYAEHLKHFDNIDMFINVASLGEMKNTVIRFWFDLIQNFINPSYILSVNRYLNTIVPYQHYWRFEENECSVLYDQKWDIAEWDIEPVYTRCPYIVQRHARYLHIVAKRLHTLDCTDLEKRSDQLYDEVINSDEFKFSKVDVSMTHRDNVLVNDLTKQGVVFKLWESIRLNANVNNIWAMIQKLDSLVIQKEKIFEETVFYEKLLLDLLSKNINKTSKQLKEWLTQRITLRDKEVSLHKNQPVLVESYANYNIIQHGDNILAVPQKLGALNFAKIDLNNYSTILVGNNVETMRHKVQDVLSKKNFISKLFAVRNKNNIETFYKEPTLLVSFKGYNIVGYKETLFGIPQKLGDIDLTSANLDANNEIFQDRTQAGIKKKINLLKKEKSLLF